MKSRERRGLKRQAGVTMVEFIIVTPIALLMVFGIIQLGLMFSAKSIINEAAFVAARAGSVSNARYDVTSPMMHSLISALVPFYQNTLDSDPVARIANAYLRAAEDLAPQLGNLDLTVLSPSSDSFEDFGLGNGSNPSYIPNDNLEYRTYELKPGGVSGQSIQDANVLRIKVTYGYELKVPMIQSVIKAVLCGLDRGNCVRYYRRGRIPIVAYATVQMQTPAWNPNE